MKKLVMVVMAFAFVNVTAYAKVGPSDVDCKEVVKKIEQAKAAGGSVDGSADKQDDSSSKDAQ